MTDSTDNARGHSMTGRHCKSCTHLVRVNEKAFQCGYVNTIPAPWPFMEHKFEPRIVIATRHAVPGDHYPEVLGSKSDWTEVMDCPTWEGATL